MKLTTIIIFMMDNQTFTSRDSSAKTHTDRVNLNNLYEARLTLGTILLIDCPELMDFGIDNQIWRVGPKFMGINMIPHGPHYIYYSLKDENYQIRQGFFIFVDDKNKNFIKKWNKGSQDFVILKPEEKENFEIGLNNLDFDAFLGNYPQDKIEIWKEVSYLISKKTLDKIEPISKCYITTSKEYEKEGQLQVKSNIYFTELPTKQFIHKKSPEKLTEYFMDKSAILTDLINREFEGDYHLLFSELQYAFVVFLLGEVYEGFEQWKNILLLIFSSKEAIVTQPKLFCDFIELIYFQIRNYPKDFFRDEILVNNFFSKLLEGFILFCYEEKERIHNSVFQRVVRLRKFLKEVFNFNIMNEEEKILTAYLQGVTLDDEDLPTVVMNEEI